MPVMRMKLKLFGFSLVLSGILLGGVFGAVWSMGSERTSTIAELRCVELKPRRDYSFSLVIRSSQFGYDRVALIREFFLGKTNESRFPLEGRVDRTGEGRILFTGKDFDLEIDLNERLAPNTYQGHLQAEQKGHSLIEDLRCAFRN